MKCVGLEGGVVLLCARTQALVLLVNDLYVHGAICQQHVRNMSAISQQYVSNILAHHPIWVYIEQIVSHMSAICQQYVSNILAHHPIWVYIEQIVSHMSAMRCL